MSHSVDVHWQTYQQECSAKKAVENIDEAVPRHVLDERQLHCWDAMLMWPYDLFFRKDTKKVITDLVKHKALILFCVNFPSFRIIIIFIS